MNMKRVAVIAGIVIAVVLAIVLIRVEKISGPRKSRARRSDLCLEISTSPAPTCC